VRVIGEKTVETKNGLPPVHPGEILKQDILPHVGLSVTAAAKALGVSRQMLHDILAERLTCGELTWGALTGDPVRGPICDPTCD